MSYERHGVCTRLEFNPVIPRLISKTVQTEEGCWLYCGGIHSKQSDHRKIGLNGKRKFVHRASWMLFNGTIPEDKQVLHSCIGHGNCWNPRHLYLGTPKNNAEDRKRQGRNGDHRGEKNGKCRLTETEVTEIRGQTCGFTYSQIAEMYGIRPIQVSQIRRRICWSHI